MGRWLFHRLTFLSWIALLLIGLAWTHSLVAGGVVTVRQYDQELVTLNGVEYVKTYTLAAGRFWRTQAGEGLSIPLQEVDRTLTYASAKGAMPPADAAPLWPAIVLTAILPAVYLLRRVRRRPARPVGAIICEFGTWVGAGALGIAIFFCLRSGPYFERADIRLRPGPAALQVNSARGSVMLAWTESGPARKLREPGAFLFQRSTVARYPHPLAQDAGFVGSPVEVLGFAWGGDGTTSIGRKNVLVMPYWFVFAVIVLVTLPFALGTWRGRRRALRLRRGLCVGCGYDLRGVADRCPECGTAFRPLLINVRD